MKFQVLGMVSRFKELFLFEKGIPLEQDNWFIKVESEMQSTIAKMISYAVSSFPKQSLDLWILDYPQQVVTTTLHLILSHEINEILEANMAEEKEENLGDDIQAEDVDASSKNDAISPNARELVVSTNFENST